VSAIPATIFNALIANDNILAHLAFGLIRFRHSSLYIWIIGTAMNAVPNKQNEP
jgi:hypothetical protein